MENFEHGERRSETRFPISIPVDYSLPELSSKKAFTKNISSKGLTLQTDCALPEGVVLNFRLIFDSNIGKLACKGKSVWHRLIGEGKFLIGIKLDSPALKPIPLVLQSINLKLK
jgi:hypothetical protein